MADNYCACNGGDDAEYIIELNQQGPPGVQGEQGEQGYSPVVSYTVNNDTIQFTLVNQDTTSTTPNFYNYVAKKSVVDNHGILIQNNTDAIDGLETNKLDKDGSNADSNFTVNNLPILTFGTVGSRLGNGSQLPTLALQARNINVQGYNSNDQRVNFISLSSNGVVNISASNQLVMSGSSDRPSYNGNSLALLSDIPTIPTVGNGTITLTQGGVTKGTFTTNQSGNTTIELDAGGGAITNPLIINDEDSTYSLRMGITTINQTRQPFMSFYTSSASGVSIELINSATAPIKLNDLWAGLKTIALNYDNNTLKVNQDGQLYADISVPTYTAGTGIDITNDTISIDNTVALKTDIPSLTGYATEQWVGQQGYITGITSSDVTTALGYTPYNSTNPNGYTSNVGTVTSVNNTQPDANGNVTISIPDVSNYYTKAQVDALLQAKQDLIDALTARVTTLETNINGGNA